MTIGLPSRPIEAGGETYSPSEIRAILKRLASLGINEDKIIAQINPREAAVLKSMGGSGKVNPATGLLSFDDGGGGGDGGGGDGGGGDGGGDSGGGGNDGGDDSGGNNDGGSDLGGGWGDDSDNQGNDPGSGWGGYTSGTMGDTYGFSALSDQSIADQNVDLTAVNAPEAVAEALQANAPTSLAQTAIAALDPQFEKEFAPEVLTEKETYTPSVPGLNLAAPQAPVGPVGYSPEVMAVYNSLLQENANKGTPLSQSQTMAQALAAVNPQAPEPQQQQVAANAPNFGSLNLNAFATPTAQVAATPEATLNPEFWSSIASPVLGNVQFATPAANPDYWNSIASPALGNVQFATPTVSAAPPTAALSSPVVAAPDRVAPIASSTTATQSPSFWSDPAGWLGAKAQNVADNPGQYATNAMMMGVPVVGTVNTLSGLLGGPTIGGMMQAGTPAGPADMSADLGGDGATPARGPLSSGSVVAASPVVASPVLGAITNPTISVNAPLKTTALLRNYRGLPIDPYAYGYGSERAYYADGGLVSQPTPPAQPTVASQPTMAYTDGQGLVGAIASPPGLSPYDTVGSDGPHGSPMAFSPAAAAPTMTPDAPVLATHNVNASPVAAPISQNPNLGYSLGMSPLARLAGMRNV